MTPQQLIDDFTKGHKYGNLEIVFKGGRITFVKATETFVTYPTDEKNSDGMPRGEYGTHNRVGSKTF